MSYDDVNDQALGGAWDSAGNPGLDGTESSYIIQGRASGDDMALDMRPQTDWSRGTKMTAAMAYSGSHVFVMQEHFKENNDGWTEFMVDIKLRHADRKAHNTST